MKNLTLMLAALAFANGAFAEEKAPAQAPILVAQAGGSARGAALPAMSTGAGSTIVAVVAIAAAGVVAAASYNSTVSTASHH